MPRRGENIFKRKDGRWEARYVKEITADGRKKYGSVYAKNYAEVKEKQQFFISNPQIQKAKEFGTVSSVMNEWLYIKKHSVELSTFRKYETIVLKYISPQLGKISVKLLKSTNIAQLVESLKKENIKFSYINYILSVLKMGLEYAEEEYSIKCPKIIKLKDTSSGEKRVLSKTEEQKLINYCINRKEDIYCFGVLFALYTGLRIGEICALEWNDIKDGKIYITKTMQRIKDETGKTAVVTLSPKTAKSNRIIPIPNAIANIVNTHLTDEGYVIHKSHNKFVEPRLMQKKFKQISDDCGLENVHFHTLRHTFATRCIEAGVDVKTLSEILGHSKVSTTLSIYVHSTIDSKIDAMNKLELCI